MRVKNELWFVLTAPLNNGDTEQQTYGCRHSNPEICKACFLDEVCAFSSSDNICKRPSKSWKRYYHKLLGEKKDEENN